MNLKQILMWVSCALIATTLTACGGRNQGFIQLGFESDIIPSKKCSEQFPGDYQAQVACQQGTSAQRRDNYLAKQYDEKEEEYDWQVIGYQSVKYDAVRKAILFTLDCTKATASWTLQSACVKGQNDGRGDALADAGRFREKQLENARQQGRNNVGPSPSGSSGRTSSSSSAGRVNVWKIQ